MRNKLFELLMYAYALNDDSTAEDHAHVGTCVERLVRRDKLIKEHLTQIAFGEDMDYSECAKLAKELLLIMERV